MTRKSGDVAEAVTRSRARQTSSSVAGLRDRPAAVDQGQARSVSSAYTLTACSPSFGSGSGIRWMPVRDRPRARLGPRPPGVRRDRAGGAGRRHPADPRACWGARVNRPGPQPPQPQQPGDRQHQRHEAVAAAVVGPHRGVGEQVAADQAQRADHHHAGQLHPEHHPGEAVAAGRGPPDRDPARGVGQRGHAPTARRRPAPGRRPWPAARRCGRRRRARTARTARAAPGAARCAAPSERRRGSREGRLAPRPARRTAGSATGPTSRAQPIRPRPARRRR